MVYEIVVCEVVEYLRFCVMLFFFVILIIEYEVLVSFIVKSCEVWEKMILVKRKRGEDCMDKVYINI